jgi:hypothetical protein
LNDPRETLTMGGVTTTAATTLLEREAPLAILRQALDETLRGRMMSCSRWVRGERLHSSRAASDVAVPAP